MGLSGEKPFRRLTVEGSVEDLESGRVALSLNEPRLADGGRCIVEGPLVVRGWAHARGGIESVVVTVDGRRFEALRPIVRTDLLAYYGADAATEGGFALRLHPTECPPGAHRVSVVATGCEGDAVGVEGEVVCAPDPLEAGTPPESSPKVDWIEERATPRPAPASGETYDPDRDAGTVREAAHRLRCVWAREFAEGKDVLDLNSGAGDPAKLPFADRSFDLVTWFEAPPPDSPAQAIAGELRRVLRPGGLLLAVARDELRDALDETFSNVRAYRQRTSLASVLLDDADAGESVDLALHDLSLAERDGDRDEHVVVATDGELPHLRPAVAFASPESIERLHGMALMWESRALAAEADAAASRVEAGLASTQQEATLRMLRAAEARLRELEES